MSHVLWLVDNGNDYNEMDVYYSGIIKMFRTPFEDENSVMVLWISFIFTSKLISKKSSINLLRLTLICFCWIYQRKFDQKVIKVRLFRLKLILDKWKLLLYGANNVSYVLKWIQIEIEKYNLDLFFNNLKCKKSHKLIN